MKHLICILLILCSPVNLGLFSSEKKKLTPSDEKLYYSPKKQDDDFLEKDFIIKYKPLQSRSEFIIENLKEEQVAKIVLEREKADSFGFSFSLPPSRILAKAEGFHKGTEESLKVYDENQREIGFLLRKKNPFSPATFQLFDSHKNLIAEGAMTWIGNRFTLVDPDNSNKEFAIYYRPYFRLLRGDYWYIKHVNTEALNFRLVILAGAWQAYLEKWNCEILPPHN